MGGTFDPIHFGHLVTAEEALVQFNLDRVVFMPAGRPARKSDVEVTSAEHRYLMTVIATAANPDFEVSRMEIDRPGVTYTVDTLNALRDIHGPVPRSSSSPAQTPCGRSSPGKMQSVSGGL
jgi:nicotinate-nucleotide adenylyltransferase